MNEYELKHTSVRLPIKYIHELESRGKNLSEFLRQLLEDYFKNSEEAIDNDIKECEEKLAQLRQKKENFIKQNNFESLSDDERAFLTETAFLMENSPQYKQGRVNRFNQWKIKFRGGQASESLFNKFIDEALKQSSNTKSELLRGAMVLQEKWDGEDD